MSRTARSIITLLLSALLHACAREVAVSPAPVAARLAPISVHVVNNTLGTLKVYVVREGVAPVLLGKVMSFKGQWWTCPSEVFPGFSPVRLVAVSGESATATAAQIVHPGGYVEWVLGDVRAVVKVVTNE